MAYRPRSYGYTPYRRRLTGPNQAPPTGGVPPQFPPAAPAPPNPRPSAPQAPYRPTPSPNPGPSTGGLPPQFPPGQRPGGAPGQPGGAPGSSPFPLDPAYELALGAAQNRYDQTIAGLGYQEQRTRQDYGFDDPSDPFNKAAMLQRAFQQSQDRTLNMGASRGQLYSGATQSNLDEGGFQNQESYDQLRRAYADALQGIQQQRAGAGADYQTARSQAYGDRVDRALSTRPEDPGAQQDLQRGYARLDEIRAFLSKHPDLAKTNPARYQRLVAEAGQLKGRLPSRRKQ